MVINGVSVKAGRPQSQVPAQSIPLHSLSTEPVWGYYSVHKTTSFLVAALGSQRVGCKGCLGELGRCVLGDKGPKQND